ncbi:hypothetical protein ACFY93_01915 [Streptomyces sp. NPDC008313]|uniref:hypothetical protein n=1 Tax=Streptomyces sp. NPDC008313 TaxID=3364826 RepID=UPI0036F03058
MKRLALSRTGTAIAASAFSLALVTGCSDSGSDSGSDSKPSSASADKGSSATGTVLSKGELKKLLITAEDVDGFKVESTGKSEQFASSKDDIKVKDEKCAPLAYVSTGFSPGDSAADVNLMATEEGKPAPAATSTKKMEDMTDEELDAAMDAATDALGGTVTVVSLSSYEGGSAQDTMSAVREAVKGCTGGFTATTDGETQRFTKVEAEKASGIGDESVAFAVTADAEGEPALVHGEIARHGNTIATYYSLSLASFAGKDAPKYDIPKDLIKAQAAKLD